MTDPFWNQLRTGADERFSGFGHLMPFRVQEILLVASMYDAFTLEEGGRLTELLLSEYRELNLSFAPRITKAGSGNEVLELLEARRFDLVVTMSRLGDLQAAGNLELPSAPQAAELGSQDMVSLDDLMAEEEQEERNAWGAHWRRSNDRLN